MENNKSSLFHTPSLIPLLAKEYNNANVVNWTVEGKTIYGIESRFSHWIQLWILPFGLYLPDLSKEEYQKFIFIIEQQKDKYAKIVINNPPNLSFNISDIKFQQGFKLIQRSCQVLKLNKPIDEIIKEFSDTRKKHIKRFQKKGALTIFPTNEKKYFEQYFEIYKETLVRWGEKSPAYSFELISNLYKVENVKLWVALHNDKMLSGMICFYGENCVFDWLAATIINDEYKKLYPAVAVQYAVIENASEQGLDFVNMGASDNLEGVKEFKESWNTTILNYQTLIYQKKSFRFFKKIQFYLSKISGIFTLMLICIFILIK